MDNNGKIRTDNSCHNLEGSIKNSLKYSTHNNWGEWGGVWSKIWPVVCFVPKLHQFKRRIQTFIVVTKKISVIGKGGVEQN